ncbi:heme A synthase [Pseudoxanthomonas sp. SGD-10]|nr:heme A synthase [Pseudoxanthomonas sp. SGD-10]
MDQKKEKRFIRYNLYAIISLFVVILAGGIVRSTGAGMGCPDWPKCFDHYIPPTDVSQLPADYQEKYVQERLKKNERFAKMLEKSGFSDLAYKVRHDESIKVPEEFNATKTYTEYINRLAGAVCGIFLLLTFVFSIAYAKTATRIFVLSFINLLLIFFQAWLGSIVVSTNLLAWTITVHMLFAVLIIAIAIYTYHYANALRDHSYLTRVSNTVIRFVLIVSLLLSTIQIIIGTEVREAIDALLTSFPTLSRYKWLNNLGEIYFYHKALAIGVVVISVLIVFLTRQGKFGSRQLLFANVMIGIVLFQYLTGLILHHLGMPPYAQALHVLFATVMFGVQFYLVLLLKSAERIIR